MSKISIKVTATNPNAPDCGIRHEFTSFLDYLEWDRAGFDEIYRESLGEVWSNPNGSRLSDDWLRVLAERLDEAYPEGLDVNSEDFLDGFDEDIPHSFQGLYNLVCEYIEDIATAETGTPQEV